MITASQSFKIYQLLFKHFKNEEDSQASVQKMENVIEDRFEKETNRLATKDDIERSKSDMIKWMFVFWVAQMLAFIGLYLKK